MKLNLIRTIEEKCQGCNKCIRVCPIFEANIAYNVDGHVKVKINQEKCIGCGKCIDVCEHNAREYKDDTKEFFNDLAKNRKISLIVAPSVRVNFNKYKKLLGFFKSKGVNVIYDVSFGADITTWAYLKVIKENNLKGSIAQPCPVIVNYIEKYKPQLISKLTPIQSPMMCAAIYLKKYMENSDDIAFLSPCIAKSEEINDDNTFHYVKYNVTFNKLHEYLQEKNIDLEKFNNKDFDNMECSLGALYPRPGGLSENIEAFYPDVWIKRVEGQDRAYKYLDNYVERIKQNKELPFIVDILNCTHGCNLGTGACPSASPDDIDCELNRIKREKINKSGRGFKKNYIQQLKKYFDNTLNVHDFIRKYSDYSNMTLKEPSQSEYEEIFKKLHKYTDESKTQNCFTCGYDTCKDMCKAIMNNLNITNNCIDYNRSQIAEENVKLGDKNKEVENMIQKVKAMGDEKIKKADAIKQKVKDITSAMSEVSSGNQQSSQNIMDIMQHIQDTLSISNTLRGSVDDMKSKVEKFNSAIENIVDISQETNLLSLNASIESARAGQAGKGFSVVAGEVSKLAESSKTIAVSTKQEEEELNVLVNNLIKIASQLEDNMNVMSSSIETISGTVEEITAQSQEVVASAEQIANS
ncbi:4Fe-4S dicluster domain-containing protein [Clostridium autoethanogenum]|uniref:4Fe-4S dicluster domain-containing protein n=1 Tax=Clostridium autoethanogenum TaxID=84023 RepID=A0A3M0SDU4_9CLOT|nr:[Fe-Fe] hydrogenase large subunit C-terminal domain-containing protein [Clostridium autoethanogenum]RMC96395.1 4Fe-4S dicluster domain-containing protein [Clostridium autoethanogenum]